MKKIIALLLVFTFGLSSCEKDDICDANTPTTPRLVISFFDITAPTTPKNVTNLKVIGEGQTEGIIFNKTGTEITKYQTSANTISIPLKTDDNSTTYTFILDSGNANPAAINTDVIKFNYTHNNVYVSRACGFKTLFTLNPSELEPLSTPFEQTDPGNDGLWMQRVIVLQSNVESENETHIKVLF
ncbi:DUF6452 family protein [Flavobacterium sp.]|uniref:DUF6452 family protein n=1 Tax=Flavobacterium sp. TaxID=239 RepID=UPI00374CC69D